jgi:hypothetical protein
VHVAAASDFAASLLAAEPSERERLLRDADPRDLEAVVNELGRTRETAAAEVLALLEQVVEDRGLRKAARRELHRLRSVGIEPPPPTATASAEPEPSRAHAPLEPTDVWITEIDPSGTRALWLVADRALGGIWFAALLLNDVRGLQEMTLVDTTRKRFQRDFEESRQGAGIWINLPASYALGLIREAVDLTREVGGALPTRYRAFRETFGEAPGAPERALVYETISPAEANFHPEWLEESARLVTEPEVGGWYVPLPAELRARAREVARAPMVGLLVPGHEPEQQALELLAEAGQRGLTPAVRRAFRRRFEETAYIFLMTDRLNAAHAAVAVARSLEDPALSPDMHPLLRLLVASGLARLVGSDQVGSRRASEALLELIDRAIRQMQPGQVATRPSGLILPR